MKIFIKILIASILANVMLSLLCYVYGYHIEMGDSILFGETLQESMHGIVYGSAPIEWTNAR